MELLLACEKSLLEVIFLEKQSHPAVGLKANMRVCAAAMMCVSVTDCVVLCRPGCVLLIIGS